MASPISSQCYQDSIDLFANKFIQYIELLRNIHDINEDTLWAIFKKNVQIAPQTPVLSSATQVDKIKCTHILKNGNTCKRYALSTTDGTSKCKQHMILTATKTTSNKNTNYQSRDDDDDSQMFIRKNKHGNFVYGGSGLVLKSSKEKYVIGKQVDTGIIVNLTDEDIERCKKYKLRFKRNYVANQ